MNQHYPLMIPGSSAPAGELIVYSPFSGEAIASVAQCDESHIEQALQTSYGLYRQRQNWLSTVTRIEILERVVELMRQEQDSLAKNSANEGGKPLTDSQVEVSRAINSIKLCIEHINSHAGEVIPLHEANPENHRIAFTQKEPIGVVVAVSAFNHPLNLIVHQVGAAIASGCPTIVKPAGDTPLSCIRFVQLLHQAGLPPSWCQLVIPKGRDLSTRLVTDSRVGLFSFIGSARVGWMLRSKVAPGTRCLLEHGGVAPLIVGQTADTNKLIPALVKGGFYHAGQVCVSVQRIYVPNNKLEQISQLLAQATSELIVGDPLSAKTQVGPLIRQAEVERIEQWVEEAVSQGAQLLCGGKRILQQCFQPTVLVNPPLTAKVSSLEVFAPVVSLYGYEDVNEAIALANGLDYAFQAAVFTENIDEAMAISHQLDASAVMINEHTAFRHDGMPFAGLRQSGLGVGGINHTIDEMQINKMIMLKTSLKL